VYIDAVQTRGAGYLLDYDGDGIYDAFYSDDTHHTTTVQYQDGSYLIDGNGDGTWDYTYSETKGLQSYREPQQTPGFILITVLCSIGIAIILWKRKSRK
jgi:hypothetical protein